MLLIFVTSIIIVYTPASIYFYIEESAGSIASGNYAKEKQS